MEVIERRPTKKKILVVGGSLSGNEGAAAMTYSAVGIAREIWPHSDVTILSPRYERDLKRSKELPGVRVVRWRYSERRAGLVLALLLSLLASILPSSARKGVVERFGDEILREMIRSDVLLDVTGDMYSEDYGTLVCLFYLGFLLIPVCLDRAVVIMPQSIGPFKSVSCRMLARYVFNRVSMVFAREEITGEFLQKLGLKKELFRFDDIAFHMNPSPACPIPLSDELPCVGVALSSLIGRFGDNPDMAEKQYVETMAKFVDSVVDRGYEVILVPHVKERHWNDDRIIGRKVMNLVRGKGKVMIIEDDYNAMELKHLIGRCSFFVGSRMHANIAAMSQGVPVISIAYSHKFRGIQASFGLEEYVIDFRDLSYNMLVELFDRMVSNRQQLTEILESRNREIRESYKAFKAILAGRL